MNGRSPTGRWIHAKFRHYEKCGKKERVSPRGYKSRARSSRVSSNAIFSRGVSEHALALAQRAAREDVASKIVMPR